MNLIFTFHESSIDVSRRALFSIVNQNEGFFLKLNLYYILCITIIMQNFKGTIDYNVNEWKQINIIISTLLENIWRRWRFNKTKKP